MSDQLSEEQQRIISEAQAQWQQEDRHSVLSQDEINTLLSAYESANAPGRLSGHRKERQVRLYDFAKPDRFSKEHLRALQLIHDNFTSELSTELSTLCAAPTRADLISIDQVTYKQYRSAIATKTLLAEVSISTMMCEIIIAVNSSIVGVWVDYLCGGNPNIAAAPSDLTPLDIAVAGTVLEHVVKTYSKAWPGAASIEAKIERVADYEFTDEMLSPSETVLVCNCEVQTGSSVGLMTICIPAAGVELMLPSVSLAQSNQSSSRRRETSPEETARALSTVRMPCSVVLGTATTSLSDLAGCEVGDVLRLNSRAGDEAEFRVSGRHVFNCRPGHYRGNMAIVISGLADAYLPQGSTQAHDLKASQPAAAAVATAPIPESQPMQAQGDMLAAA